MRGRIRLRRLPLLAAAVLALGGGAVPVAQAVAGHTGAAVLPKLDCSQLSSLDFSTVKDAPGVVSSAAQVTDKGVTYCDVRGYIEPQTQYEIRLPVSTWTGRYVQEGCGGICGYVPTEGRTPTPQLAEGCAPVDHGEIVLASDNEGHLGRNQLDGLWGKDDPKLRAVFGFSSEHSLAQFSKAVIDRYYGHGPARSYFDGCSDGGREALMEAQRYPSDFDGILAGSPVLDASDFAGELETWVYRSNTGADGHPILTADKIPALHAAVLRSCAGSTGVIDDPRTCGFEPASLQCPPHTDTAQCLTPRQVAVVRAFYRGPSDGMGHNLNPGGLPYGSEPAWIGWDVPASGADGLTTIASQFAINYLKYLAYPKNPPDSFTLGDFRFTDDAYRGLQQTASTYNATNPDLTAFHRHGGKIILYHGWADQAVSPFTTTAYYRATADRTHGYADFSRLYMIPAQYHCLLGGDPQATGDLLSPLMTWVEHGTAPETVTFPTVNPGKGHPASISVKPYDPYAHQTERGYNTGYHWIGQFH